MSEEILRPIPYLEYSLADHPAWFFYEQAFFTSGKHKGKPVKERDILPHRDTPGERAKVWKSNYNVSRNIIEVPARETWCEIRDVVSDRSGKCMNGNIVLRPWHCSPHDSHSRKLTKKLTDPPVLKMLNMVLSGHNAYRKSNGPGVYVAILIGTGAPYVRWSLDRLGTAGLPSANYYSKPLFGYYFIPNKARRKGAPPWIRNPTVPDRVFRSMLLSLGNQRIARVFRFIQYRLVVLPFKSKREAHGWTARVRSGTAWIGETTHASPSIPWFHGEGHQAIPQEFIDQLKSDKARSLLFPHPLVTAAKKTTVPKGIRQAITYLPTYIFHATEAAAKRGKPGTVMTLFDAEISFQVARPSLETRPQEVSLPDSLRGAIVAVDRDRRGRVDLVFRGKKAHRGQEAEDEVNEEEQELYRKHPVGLSKKPKGKAIAKAGPRKAPRHKKP